MTILTIREALITNCISKVESQILNLPGSLIHKEKKINRIDDARSRMFFGFL